MFHLNNFIDNQHVDPIENKWLDNYRPDTGEVYSKVALSNATDVEKAVKAAQNAFPAWRKLPIDKRSQYLHRIADLIDKYQEKLAQAESLDNGKPISLARRVDIPRASANFRFF